MYKNKEAKNLDAAIAGEINICNIFRNEEVTLDFEKEDGTNWEGDYSFFIFNSTAKNDERKIDGAVTVNGSVMKLAVNPTLQNIEAGKYYYEIFDEVSKRVQFLGILEINK